ncbi:phosphatase PAP2 family protein [Streptomyces sp. NPDC059460]|uniref:phosphatase PAP2 family protein n=1 Tax=Streptomyces sp. NPDC059460 TaxID=3346840 RepID=UPI0036970A60
MTTAALLAVLLARHGRSWPAPRDRRRRRSLRGPGDPGQRRRRPYPAAAVVTETGFSFSSRHTTVATALLLATAYLLARRTRSRTGAAAWWGAALALSALVAASRVYLGVHWATDVTAGFALGAAAALALITADLGYGLRAHHRNTHAVNGPQPDGTGLVP